MKLWIKAIDSAWRAGLKQYRQMRTKQRNRATLARQPGGSDFVAPDTF